MPRTGWGIWHELGHCFFTASIAQSSVLYCAPAPGLIELWLLWKNKGFFLTTLNTRHGAKCNYWQYNITISSFRTGIHSICGLGSDLSVNYTKMKRTQRSCQINVKFGIMWCVMGEEVLPWIPNFLLIFQRTILQGSRIMTDSVGNMTMTMFGKWERLTWAGTLTR